MRLVTSTFYYISMSSSAKLFNTEVVYFSLQNAPRRFGDRALRHQSDPLAGFEKWTRERKRRKGKNSRESGKEDGHHNF